MQTKKCKVVWCAFPPARSSLESYNREIEELKREMQQSTRTAQAIR